MPRTNIPLQDRPSHRHAPIHDSGGSAEAVSTRPNPGSSRESPPLHTDGADKSTLNQTPKTHRDGKQRDSDSDDSDQDYGMDDHHDNTTSLLRGQPTSHKRTSSTFSDDFDPPPDYDDRGSGAGASPEVLAKQEARKRYLYAGVFLVITLVSFVIQTELSAYVQQDLGWNKAYCMLYLTHGSWCLLGPAQLLILRIQDRFRTPWTVFWRRHVQLIRSTAHMVTSQDLSPSRHKTSSSPWPYLLRTTAIVTSALTVAGLSWYIAVDMTSPSDLTAIYNCSAFFAYAFSVPLLKEKLRLDKSIAVLIAIAGVLVVAYGDSSSSETQGGGNGDGGGGQDDDQDPSAGTDSAGTRFLGNMIIGAGSVLYGLYEVLYKRWACPPEGVSPMRGTIFANVFGSCIGVFTLTVLWIPLPFLHWLGWETFELPDPHTALWLWVSVVMNATFAGSFLVLISLTSPVLSSVASLLTIFIVAIADWVIKGETLSPAALVGGVGIIIAFLMLSWSTWREMTEEAAERKVAAAHAHGDDGRLPVDEEESDDEGGLEEGRRG